MNDKKKADPEAPAPLKKKMGRPFHAPTAKSRKRVRMLAGLGFTQEEIGMLLELGDKALRRHYAQELRVGCLEADEKVMLNLFRMATGNGPEAGRMSIFYAKVKRKWHEVQRVIHGYDPETINGFVKGVVQLLRRELPKNCPHCKTALDLPQKIALQLQDLSNKLAEKLPPSEIVPMPRPQLASDGLEAPDAVE